MLNSDTNPTAPVTDSTVPGVIESTPVNTTVTTESTTAIDAITLDINGYEEEDTITLANEDRAVKFSILTPVFERLIEQHSHLAQSINKIKDGYTDNDSNTHNWIADCCNTVTGLQGDEKTSANIDIVVKKFLDVLTVVPPVAQTQAQQSGPVVADQPTAAELDAEKKRKINIAKKLFKF